MFVVTRAMLLLLLWCVAVILVVCVCYDSCCRVIVDGDIGIVDTYGSDNVDDVSVVLCCSGLSLCYSGVECCCMITSGVGVDIVDFADRDVYVGMYCVCVC